MPRRRGAARFVLVGHALLYEPAARRTCQFLIIGAELAGFRFLFCGHRKRRCSRQHRDQHGRQEGQPDQVAQYPERTAAEHLVDKMREANKRNLVRLLPKKQTVERWIESAKKLPTIIRY